MQIKHVNDLYRSNTNSSSNMTVQIKRFNQTKNKLDHYGCQNMAANMNLDTAFGKIKETYSFKFQTLKVEQKTVISQLLNGKSCVGIFPTGFGKSAIFTLFPLFSDLLKPSHHAKIVLVISPLISLMKDQIKHLTEIGISCIAITNRATMTAEEIDGIAKGEYKILYMSPETFHNIEQWRRLILDSPIYKQRVCLITVDEAHLLETWGNEFRPAYNKIGELQSHFVAPYLLLTATCTQTILDCLLRKLHLQCDDVHIETLSPDRQNIFIIYKSVPGMSVLTELDFYLQAISNDGRSCPKAILYVKKIRSVGQLFRDIMDRLGNDAYDGRFRTTENRHIDMYHSGLDESDKQRIFDEFVTPNSVIRLMISTVAFGLGIDIPDVKYIFHWGICHSISEYWQEVGRAGRDGSQSYAYTFATRMSLSDPTSEMAQMCKTININNNCIRSMIMYSMSLNNVDHSSPLKLRKVCSDKCVNCSCEFCKCCSICQRNCPCTK